MRRHTVIITGATRGLGRELALAFARAGHAVIGLYAHDESSAEELRADLASLSGQTWIVRHDLTSDDASLWTLPQILAAESLVLINNAWGSFTPTPFHLLKWDDFQRGLDVGVKGSFNSMKALLRPMVKAGRGLVVNVLTSATHGLPPKGFAAYVTAKHALRGLMLALIAEYGSRGVRAFSVSPAFMATSMTAGWDARLVDAVESSGAVSDPVVVAARVLQWVEDEATPGIGEDYTV